MVLICGVIYFVSNHSSLLLTLKFFLLSCLCLILTFDINAYHYAVSQHKHTLPHTDHLKAPAECRASLVRRRNHQCAVVLRIIDGWCYEKAMVKVFVHWVGITLAHMEQEREEVRWH